MANRIVRVVAAVIEREGKYLITQRRDNAVLPRLWEFPGGRVEEGESDDEALRREVLGRIGVEIKVAHALTERHHSYERYDVHLTLFACELPLDAEPQPLLVRDVRWVASSDFSKYPFPPADQATMDQLLAERRD